MKIISWNVNGIRSVHSKGFRDWVIKDNPDIVCLQELKAQGYQIPLDIIGSRKYHIYHNTAQKRGYSGVGVFTKRKPQSVSRYLGTERFDKEGRMLRLDFDDFTLLNIYIPHGGRQKENLDYKLNVYHHIFDYVKAIDRKNIIVVGDFNIAHNEIDLERPKQNKKNIMFTSEERQQIDKLIRLGFVDTFRHFHKNGGHYTWWPWMANARTRNLGWRIDYQFISRSMLRHLKSASILKEVTGSDHCPIETVLSELSS